MESIQKKLSRVRSPRVHITYDVEIGDAIVQRELPLIVGKAPDPCRQTEIPVREIHMPSYSKFCAKNGRFWQLRKCCGEIRVFRNPIA